MAAPSILGTLPLLFTAGVLLVALEINRPGRVLPGCVGLFAMIWTLAALGRLQQITAIIFLVAGLALSALDLLRANRILCAFAALAYFAGFFLPCWHTHTAVAAAIAILCSLFLGITLAKLSRIAHLARSSKRKL